MIKCYLPFSIWAQKGSILAPKKGANKLNVATKHSFIIDETLKGHLPQKIVRLMVDTAKKLIQDDTRSIIFFSVLFFIIWVCRATQKYMNPMKKSLDVLLKLRC